MAGPKSTQTRFVGIIISTIHPYACFLSSYMGRRNKPSDQSCNNQLTSAIPPQNHINSFSHMHIIDQVKKTQRIASTIKPKQKYPLPLMGVDINRCEKSKRRDV